MRWIGWAVWLLTVLTIGVASSAIADEPPEPGDADRVLAEWHRRASSITSIEATFRCTDRSLYGDEKKFAGRVVLTSPNLALFESTTLDKGGKPDAPRERIIWTGKSVLIFHYENNSVDKINYRTEWPEAPFARRLPFLNRLSVDQAKEHFDWMIVREDPGRVWLEAKLRDRKLHPSWPERYIIELDKTNYFPKQVVTTGSGGQERSVFDVSAVKINEAVEVEELKAPCLDAWKVNESSGRLIEWLGR
jgi:outer membrane lipoprotein-sorting protein